MKIAIKIDPSKLRYCRLKRELTLEEVGKRLGGMHKVNVGKWELGLRPVPVKYHDALCEMLGVTIDAIRKPTSEELADKERLRQEAEADNAPEYQIEALTQYGTLDAAPLLQEISEINSLTAPPGR